MSEEAGAQRFDGCLDAVAKLTECASTGLDRIGTPAFEPAVLGSGLGVDWFESCLVSEEVEGDEVAEGFSFEHGLEVELDVRLTHEAG